MPGKNSAAIDKASEMTLQLYARAKILDLDMGATPAEHARVMRAAAHAIESIIPIIALVDTRVAEAAEKIAEAEGLAAVARKNLLGML